MDVSVEQILGRMHPADPKRPQQSRSDKVGTYERFPLDEPEKTDRLVAMDGQSIRLRIRKDLPSQVAAVFENQTYVAGVEQFHDRQRHTTEFRHHYEFAPGQERDVGFAHGVFLLMDRTHGTYLEEVPHTETSNAPGRPKTLDPAKALRNATAAAEKAAMPPKKGTRGK